LTHLPVLQIALPLIAAPLCVLLRHARAVQIFAVLVAWACLGIALALLGAALPGGAISYELGGWPAPLGIEYRVDLANAFVLVVVSALGAVVLPIGPGRRGHAVPPRREYLFYASFLLCMAGLMGVAITGDIFNVFVFLEISSLAAYTLIALGRQRQALRAAFSYLMMGTIGGTFVLIGIGFLYQMTGTLNMADLQRLLPAVQQSRSVHAAFAFLTVGIGIKLAVFPLHQWLPNAYSFAPPAVSAFLASTATKVAYYLLVRLAFGVDLRGLSRRMPWTFAAIAIGGLGLIGAPGTAGFVSKWYLVLAALSAGRPEVAFAVLLSSLLAGIYVWRVLEAAWFRDPVQSAPRGEAPLRILIPTWVLIGASLYFGVFTEWTAGIAEAAARQLLEGAP